MVSMNSYDHVVCGEGDCEAFLAMFMVTVIVLNMIVVTAAATRKLPTTSTIYVVLQVLKQPKLVVTASEPQIPTAAPLSGTRQGLGPR